ncbi:hypothetical protein WJX73_008883 [Symbiochloris irregularis]|uniref:Major facilitator superfamily (MFS) profile domain-containing protein n=1 Tax=Symbiochloris irregularis TaxID=706552 RepID=A0AAW1NSC1_9CHLO
MGDQPGSLKQAARGRARRHIDTAGRARRGLRVSAKKPQEAEWEDELSAGGQRSRTPQLQYARITVPGAAPSPGNTQMRGSEEASSAPQEVEVSAAQYPAWLQRLVSKWENLPARHQFVVATSLAFVVCNMDKVNISVAIIPMSRDFGWDSTTAGLVQSSFFWGYMLTQIPGGWVTSRLGGRRVLPAGVGLWSLATAIVPFSAGTIPGLLMSRAAVGLGEGVAPSAATDMVARIGKSSERSRSISFIFSGLHVGSLAGLLVAPQLIDHFGWQTVFFIFGLVGLGWTWWWERLMAGIAAREPEAATLLSEDRSGGGDAANIVPWRAFLRNRPVQALACTHFCNNWFHYTMLAWLPTFFTDTLSMNITQAAQISLLPPVAALAASIVAGPAADSLIEAGWEVERVRKLAQLVAFMGPATCLLTAMAIDDGYVTVGLITAALGLASFSLAGLYCNHADLSPKHAAVLLGLTNTVGAVPGIIGVAVTGALLDATGSWPVALFVPSIGFFLLGSTAFTAFGRAEQQDFSDNSPFWFEQHLQPVMDALPIKSAQSAAGKLQRSSRAVLERVQRKSTKD